MPNTLQVTLDTLVAGGRPDREDLLEADRLIRRAIAYCNACGDAYALFVAPLREILPRLEAAGLRKEASGASALPTAAQYEAVRIARTAPSIPDGVLANALLLAQDAAEVFASAGKVFDLALGDTGLFLRGLTSFQDQRKLQAAADLMHHLIQRDIAAG